MSACSRLEFLSLANCCKLSDISCLAGLPALKTLRISYWYNHWNPYLRNADFRVLGSCARLESLTLSRCKLTILPSMKACTSLRVIHLEELDNLENISSLHRCRALQELRLESCSVSAKALKVLESCTGLQKLHIVSCGLRDVPNLQSCTALEYINLSARALPNNILSVTSFPALCVLELSKDQLGMLSEETRRVLHGRNLELKESK